MFAIQKGTNSGTVHKDLKIVFNKNIGDYDRLVEINVFLGGQSPGIELCKLFIQANGNSGYLHNQIYIVPKKVRGRLTTKFPE